MTGFEIFCIVALLVIIAMMAVITVTGCFVLVAVIESDEFDMEMDDFQ